MKGMWMKNNPEKARRMGEKGGAQVYRRYGKKYFQKIGAKGGRGSKKLTEENVLEIRSLKGKRIQKELASQFNVVQSTIQSILSNRTWKHL